MKRVVFLWAVCLLVSVNSAAQSAVSLFWKADSLQIGEIVSETDVQYKNVGHHGPAVENRAAAFRIYFNDSGAIDVYSKSGRGMELERYLWYPDQEAQDNGAGCDEYMVGKTVGLGGISLWDGSSEIKLKATAGRTARVGRTPKGAFAEIVSYGIQYKGEPVDVSIRVDVYDKSRDATVTATVLNGKKVCFLTGVNYHPGEQIICSEECAGAWGVHPADVSETPAAIGAGIRFSKRQFSPVEKTDDMLRIISRPSTSVRTTIVAASVKEAEINSYQRFSDYLLKK